MKIIGIDPGKTGGAGVILNSWADVFSFTGKTPKEIFTYFKTVKLSHPDIKGIIEAVGAFPGQGVHSMFVFGENYGMLQGFLTALEIPFDKVSPVTWKKALGIAKKKGKTDRKERKRLSRALAQRLFPRTAVDDSTAEALLIAHYGTKK